MGLEINDEMIDWEEIINEADKDGGFIMSPHTVTHFKEAHRPDMFNRDGHVHWKQKGSKTLQERAVGKYHALMANKLFSCS